MDSTQKSFTCSIIGCEMTFTNKDHLNWHQKKHEMVLNLGLANKNSETADQTPTPTRFIRNCEEVGLFQDLQNVNPFDETFKKAAELAKTRTLHVPQQANNDDTLHTPHIFPPVEANHEQFSNHNTNDNQLNEFCFVSVPTVELTDEEIDDYDDNERMYDLTIDTSESDDEIEDNNSINLPMQSKHVEVIQNKHKPNNKTVQVEKPKSKKSVQSNQNNVDKYFGDPKEKEKLREMNRAAQSRCRRKKKIQISQMEDDLKRFKYDNAGLVWENQMFKHKFTTIKNIITRTRNTTPIKDPDLLNEIEHVLNSTITLQNFVKLKNSKQISTTASIIPIVPPPAATKPVLIQVVGSADQVAVSVLPN